MRGDGAVNAEWRQERATEKVERRAYIGNISAEICKCVGKEEA